MATIDILPPGMAWGTTVGIPAFCTVALVESDGMRILVDTAHVGRRVVLEEALAGRGLTPADIDLILMTHAHWDHALNFDLFRDTPMLLHAKERAYALQHRAAGRHGRRCFRPDRRRAPLRRYRVERSQSARVLERDGGE